LIDPGLASKHKPVHVGCMHKSEKSKTQKLISPQGLTKCGCAVHHHYGKNNLHPGITVHFLKSYFTFHVHNTQSLKTNIHCLGFRCDIFLLFTCLSQTQGSYRIS